jgi:ATP-dependent RNA helicase DDX18/HAS1
MGKPNFAHVLENKKMALLEALNEVNSERTLVFCNTIDQCRVVENFLIKIDKQYKHRNVYSYHSAISEQNRNENMIAFTKKLLPAPVVMICTDRASRGIDFENINVSNTSCC